MRGVSNMMILVVMFGLLQAVLSDGPALGISFSSGGLHAVAAAICQLDALKNLSNGAIDVIGGSAADVSFAGASGGVAGFVVGANSPRLTTPDLRPDYTFEQLANWSAPLGMIPITDAHNVLSETRLFACAVEVLFSGAPGNECVAISDKFATCLESASLPTCLVVLLSEFADFDADTMTSGQYPFTVQYSVSNQAAWPFSRAAAAEFDLAAPSADNFLHNSAIVFYNGDSESPIGTASTSDNAAFTPTGTRRDNSGNTVPISLLDAAGTSISFYNQPHPFLQQENGPDIRPPASAGEICRGSLDTGLSEELATTVRDSLNEQMVQYGEWKHAPSRRGLLFGSTPESGQAIATDGGMHESTSIPALLRQQVQRLVHFFNFELPLFGEGEFEGVAQTIDIFSLLFGVQTTSEISVEEIPCAFKSKNLLNPHLQVFPSSLWPQVSAAFRADGFVVLRDVGVLRNDFFGVASYTLDALVLVSNAPAAGFETYLNNWATLQPQLQRDTDNSTRNPFGWPYYGGQTEMPRFDLAMLCLSKKHAILQEHREVMLEMVDAAVGGSA